MHHVIIGAGPAGVIAAETLRKTDGASRVTIVGDEPEPPYSRMAIPYLLADNIDEAGTYLRKEDNHYDAVGIKFIRDRVKRVDRGSKTLILAGARTLSYDKLLVASGSHPAVPPVAGVDLPGVHPCWTLEDARHILGLAQKGAPVMLMGAGFIGCIILEALVRRGVKLTVVEMENRMVPRMLDETAGGHLKRWCRSKGIAVHTSAKVEGIERGSGSNLVARLDNGVTVEASLIIRATGVAPNVDFLDGSGIETDHGVLVDQHLQTSAKGIYAAGDVAQGLDFSTGEYSVHAIQPTATEHGRIAALNMLGREALYKGSLNMNVLATAGLISSSFGSWDGVAGGDSGVAVDEDAFKYLRLEFDGDRLVGALGIGLTDHVGVIRGLIQNQTALADWKGRLLENPHRVMEAYVAHSQT
jgi:NAD(P)H-nitrite reductase large subunit